ncbi:hypothetical protein ACOSQ4_029130 [Xanthoceras sorbifolium]
MILQNFLPEEAAHILAISSLAADSLDILNWSLDRFGIYSAKNGYWFDRERHKFASCSDGSTLAAWWTKVWRLNIPPKVKFFLWRTCHNWLPCMTNLARHGVPVQDLCPKCFKYNKNHFSLSLGVQILGFHQSLLLFCCCDPYIKEHGVFLFYFGLLSPVELERAGVVSCCDLAHLVSRNKWVHTNVKLLVDGVISWAKAFLAELEAIGKSGLY